MAVSGYSTTGAKVVTLPLEDAGYGFLVNVSLGTPPQPNLLMVDTGSSNDWVASVDYRSSTASSDADSETAHCYGRPQPCPFSRFDSTKSSSFAMLASSDFKTMYASFEGMDGDVVAEDLGLGTSQLTNVTLGLARHGNTNPIGMIGLGSPLIRDNGTYGARREILENMVDQGLIKTHSFAMWMGEDPSITFCGYDASKFDGELIPIPLQPNATGLMPQLSGQHDIACCIAPRQSFHTVVTARTQCQRHAGHGLGGVLVAKVAAYSARGGAQAS